MLRSFALNLPAITSQLVEGAPVYSWQIQPITAGKAPFSAGVSSVQFNGVYDPMLAIGYNVDAFIAGGGGGIVGEPSLAVWIEAAYSAVNWAGSGQTELTMEWYPQYVSPDHASVTNFRPLGFTVGRNNNTDRWASVQIDIGTDASTFRSQFNILGAGANPLSTWTNTAITFRRMFIVDSATIGLNTTVTANSHLFFRTAGVDKYYYANFNGDTNHYLWDAVNARFQVKYTFGNSNTAAATELQSSLKVDGRFACNGVAPPAQPARAVTLADVIAVLAGAGLTA